MLMEIIITMESVHLVAGYPHILIHTLHSQYIDSSLKNSQWYQGELHRYWRRTDLQG